MGADRLGFPVNVIQSHLLTFYDIPKNVQNQEKEKGFGIVIFVMLLYGSLWCASLLCIGY